MENVIVPKEINDGKTGLQNGIQHMRIRNGTVSCGNGSGLEDKDACRNDIGYCVKRKLSSSIYGSVYKGFIVKRKRKAIMEATYKNEGALDVIQEDDEWSIKKSSSSMSRDRDRDDDDSDNFVWEPMNKHVIIKTASWEKMRRLRGRHLEDPLKEIQALQLLEGSTYGDGDHHPHIIRSLAALQDDKYLYNITPYAKDGDLCGIVMNDINSNSRMSETNARRWFREILLALQHFQLKGICHRNISLDNIVVSGDSLKIIDLGMALRVPYVHPSNVGCTTDVSDGTTRLLIKPQGQGDEFTYMSPEVLNDDAFDGFAIDLWSVGVILYIMLVGCKPFKWPHLTDEQFLRLAVDGTLKESLEYWEIDLSESAIDLLQNMLRLKKGERFTLAQVMHHPWVTNSKTSVNEDGRPSIRKGKKRWSFRKN